MLHDTKEGLETGNEALRVHEGLRRIARQRSALDAAELALLREAQQLRLWRQHGYGTFFEYLETELGYAPRTAHDRIRVAEALEALPGMSAALATNAIPYSAARELTRVASPRTERAWLDHVAGKNLREIEEAVQGRKYDDDPTAPADPRLRRQRLSFVDILPETLALMRQARQIANTEADRNLDDNEVLQTILRSFIGGTSVPGEVPRPAHQISITTCRECKQSRQNGAGRDVPVSPATVEKARCDAEDLGDLEAATPARMTSTVTPRVRRQVFARDGFRCRNPACRSTRNLSIHHLEHQQHGGTHELSNICLACDGCHTLHHAGLLAIFGTADSIELVRRPAPTPVPMLEPSAGIEIVDPTHETSIDELCAIIATALEDQRSRTNSTAITHVGRSSPDTNDARDIRAHVSTASAREVVRYGDAINAPSSTTKVDNLAPEPTRT